MWARERELVLLLLIFLECVVTSSLTNSSSAFNSSYVVAFLTPLMLNQAPPKQNTFQVIWVAFIVVVKAPLLIFVIAKAASALGHSITEAQYPKVPLLSPYSNQNRAFSTLTMDVMISSKSTESKSTVWFT